MGLPSWETVEEHRWLVSLMPAFHDAQKTKTVQDFLAATNQLYFQSFRVPQPTQRHFDQAKYDPLVSGSQEREVAKLARCEREAVSQ
jgi:hypothetical protein